MRISTINLSLPKGLLEKIDREAEKEDRSRSELIRAALTAYLKRRAVWGKMFDYGNHLAKNKKLKPSDVEKTIAEVRKPS
jgi:metal-responsive CopG/Arc/MetJ family transcriptional regulator